MSIFNPVMKYYSEILALPGFVRDPFLSIGVQDIEYSPIPGVIPEEFQFPTLGELLRARGLKQVDELDPFDNRATLRWNLNTPVSLVVYDHFATVFDIGTVEHIFDTRQVFENYLRMVAVGGYFAIHGPCRNFADHGLHTFSSELFPRVMQVNGFEIVYLKYTNSSGEEMDLNPENSQDIICWCVGRKLRSMAEFVCPEQRRYDPNATV